VGAEKCSLGCTHSLDEVLNVFVVSAIAKDVPIHKTYRGVLPFIAADIVRIGLLIAFPGLALWLVRLLS
jgi:TRAP-type C4-dicarboxylate transport system permease large subunit